MLIAPMATTGAEPIGSMGNDNALAVLSDRRPPLFSYFKQLFAQVTNPPIDPIRENIVMSLATAIGGERNLLAETPEHAHKLILDQPILRNHELETLRMVHDEIFRAHTLDITWPIEDGASGHAQGAGQALRRRPRRRRRGRQRADPVRPPDGPQARGDPVAAGRRRRPRAPRARGHAPADRPRARVRRAARGPPHGDADRLRLRGDQPLPAARHRRRDGRRGPHRRRSTTPTRPSATPSRRSARAC